MFRQGVTVLGLIKYGIIRQRSRIKETDFSIVGEEGDNTYSTYAPSPPGMHGTEGARLPLSDRNVS